MVVLGVAEQLTCEVVLVHGRRRAADAELPGDEHHRVRGLAEVEHHRERDPRLGRVGRDQGDRDSRTGQVSGKWPHRGERAQVFPVAADDERPALRVLRAVCPSASPQDPIEVRRLQRAIREPADHPARADGSPDGLRLGPHLSRVRARRLRPRG